MNRYKIDWNKYSSAENYPYALYSKRPGWFKRWEYVNSFMTKEDALMFHQKLIGLPIYLTNASPPPKPQLQNPVIRNKQDW